MQVDRPASLVNRETFVRDVKSIVGFRRAGFNM